MQNIFLWENNRKSIGFHVEQLEELQIQFCPKDGNPENSDPANCGITVRTQGGKKERVRVLLIPDDTNYPSREVEIPTAAIEQHAEKYLGEYPEQKQPNFHKVFSHAINTTVLEVLSEEGPSLHRLVERGQENAVAEAIKNQADVNERAEAGWTPLLMACAQGYPKIVRMLLRAGANPDIGNVRGFTPLIFGVNYSNVEVCKLLLEYEVTVDYQDPYGETALMRAAGNGNSEIVQLLLDAGANPIIKTKKGKTAGDFAYKNGHGEIAKMLKKASKRTHSVASSARSE
jgi:ankyrin repeat protein